MRDIRRLADTGHVDGRRPLKDQIDLLLSIGSRSTSDYPASRGDRAASRQCRAVTCLTGCRLRARREASRVEPVTGSIGRLADVSAGSATAG